MQATFSGEPNELMQYYFMLNGKNNKGCNELKAFAMTLQFYSMKAYNLERHLIWLCHIQGAFETGTVILMVCPGFTKCAVDALSAQVCTDTANGCHTVFLLMLYKQAKPI